MADISKIKVSSGTYNIKDASAVAYGICTTAAATAAKVITLSGATHWILRVGQVIVVKFNNTNTAQNPTFNVNSSGAKGVWYNTSTITTSNLAYAGTANRPMQFMYNGAQWVFIGWSFDTDNDTLYASMIGATTSAPGADGLVPAPAAGDANRYLCSDGTWQVPPDTNTWVALKGSTSTNNGTAGYAPAPLAGSPDRYLRCDGTWVVPPDTILPNIDLVREEAAYLTGVIPNLTHPSNILVSPTQMVGDNDVYLTTTAGGLHAKTFETSKITGIGGKFSNYIQFPATVDDADNIDIHAASTISTNSQSLSLNGVDIELSASGNNINMTNSTDSITISSAAAKNIVLSTSYNSGGTAGKIELNGYGGISLDTGGNSTTLNSTNIITPRIRSDSGTAVHLDGSNRLVKFSSSIRYKTNVDYDLDLNDYHNQLMSFKPCTFEYKSTPGGQNLGLIAEDVYDVNPQLVNYDENFEIESFRDRDIITMLIMEAQAKDKEIQQLKDQIKQILNKINSTNNEEYVSNLVDYSDTSSVYGE